MKDIEAYLNSGIIENCCLGAASEQEQAELKAYCQQYPAVKKYYEDTRDTLTGPLQRSDSSFSKKIILKNIGENLKIDQTVMDSETQMLSTFFEISRHTNLPKLEQLLQDIQPPKDFDNIYAKPLYVADDREMILVWAKDNVPEEVHHDVDECFLILEGTVKCYVEEEVFEMKRGDFMRIPLDQSHEVIVTSAKPAKAIRSRVALS